MTETAKRAEIPCERKPGTLHSFFALKFHDGDEDLKKVEAIEKALNEAGIEITLMARDVEKWGKAEIPRGKALMRDYAFPAMKKCDCNIIEFSEKGVGLGMNGGFCYAASRPIYIIAKTGSDISTTMANVASQIIFYDKPEDLVEPFKKIVAEFPRVILASSSVVRKQMLSDAGIPFEVCESNADETPNKTKSLKDQMTEIAMRKAMAVFEKTRDRGRRLIVAAGQNIMFNGELYGKQKSVDDARKLLCKMRGSDEIYSYTGNALLLADHDKILEIVNLTDTARLVMDNLSDAEIEKYLKEGIWDKVCGAATVNTSLFMRLAEGRLSTAKGMTLEYITEMMKSL